MTPSIKIKGTKWDKKVLVWAAASYFAKKLPGFRKKKVKIKIVLKSMTKLKCRGQASQLTSKSYRILLESGLKARALISTLAHEMIHLNQWLTGKMVDLEGARYRVKWGKRIYKSTLAYRKHPWEIEAHGKEQALAEQFRKFWTDEA